MQQRNLLLDILKGFAILFVILYHLGVMPYGYLGVEVFLVIGGYLTTKSILRSKDNYWQFINKRLVRLWPLLLLLCAIALGFGWLWMLPVHYKLNCEAVIGTSVFMNNIVQYITSGDYWNGDNLTKPLMHTWYVGIMMQFYLIYPIILIVIKKSCKDWQCSLFVTLICVFVASYGLYMSSYLTTDQNFYFLLSRLFEFAAGGLVAVYSSIDDAGKRKNAFHWVVGLVAIILLLIVSNLELDAMKIRLSAIVALTTMFVIIAENDYTLKWQKAFKPIALCGTASFSLYLFHQVVFAFYRYAFNEQFTWLSYIAILALALTVGFISFYALEQPLGKFVIGNIKRVYGVNACCLFFVASLSMIAGKYYIHKGIVRDIPELGVYQNNGSETPEEYNDYVYGLDSDFTDNGRKNVLVIGDSFGRDWVNVLRESGVDSVMNISYHTPADEVVAVRVKQADVVFIANCGKFMDKYETLLPLMMRDNVYRVGNKGVSKQLSIVYNNDRYGSDYFKQQSSEKSVSETINAAEKIMFGDHFIDIMSALKGNDGQIFLFDENKKLIFGDGVHFTKAGAQKCAQVIDVWKYLNK